VASVQASVTTLTTQMAEKANQIGINVTDYGAVGDGTTPCDTALTNAIAVATTKKLYFPQNATNNATYYFTSNPILDGYTLFADSGVVLSYPSTNGVSFKKITFANDISIFSRDRNNTGKQLANIYSKLIYASTIDNSSDIGMQSVSNVNDSDITKNVYTIGATGTVGAAPIIVDSATNLYKVDTTVETATNIGRFHTLEFLYDPNYLYNCVYKCNVQETNNTFRVGVMAINNANQFACYNFNFQKTFFNSLQNAGFSETNTDKSAILTNAYSLSGSFILSTRVTDKRTFEVYINGVLMQTVTTTFDIKTLGFMMSAIVGTNIGINNTVWGGITKSFTPKLNNGNAVNGIVFGDSITFGEGAYSWAEFLPSIVEGRRGINKLTITNKAVSGQKASQQYTIMQGLDLTPFDLVLILVATNDIAGLTDVASFNTTLTNMINLAKGNNRKVVVGIPPVYITSTLTGTGFDPGNYQYGGIYRNTILQVCANLGVTVADVMSELGRIGVDNQANVLRDNIHPTPFGEALIARCFARSIITAYSNDLKGNPAIIVNNPTLQNSWVNYGAGYESVGFYKTADKIVHLKGLIKSGVVTSNTLIFTLPVGFRPSSTRLVSVNSYDGTNVANGFIEIRSDGTVNTQLNIKNTWLSLENASFNI
jgi:lysophospholipase L1-like esterase